MAVLALEQIEKRFGHVVALAGVDLTVDDGESVAVLGPSGSGKSTLLRLVAGLESLDDGTISIDGIDQAGLAPHERPVAIMFQHFALYPHLSVMKNITLGLRHGLGLSADEAERRARDVAARLEITELLERRPRAMSGGQRQRVALARAVARQAGLVLLDEPFSGLDAQLRLTMRVEVAHVLRSTGATTVHVTHDQLDAMAMADRIVLLSEGVVLQVGTPDDLYERPASTFVAGFIGTPQMNLLRTQEAVPFGMDSSTLADVETIGVRPEHVVMGSNAPWTDEGIVILTEAAGPERIVHVDVRDTPITLRCRADVRPSLGSRVAISCDPADIHAFDADGRRLGAASEMGRSDTVVPR